LDFTVRFYGNEVAPGRIQGFVGFDADGDQMVLFPDDPLYAPGVSIAVPPGQPDRVISGATVWLDVNQNGVFDANEPSQITGADGNYYFDVPFDTWQVGIVIPEGFTDLLDPSNTSGVILSGL